MKKTTDNLLVPLALVGKLYDHMIRVVKHVPDDKPKKNIILYIGKVYPHMVEAIRAYGKKHDVTYRIGLLYDPKQKFTDQTRPPFDDLDIILTCDFSSDESLQKALSSLQDEIWVVTVRGDDMIPRLQRVIPYVPYVRTPTEKSLSWASDKILMRQHLKRYNPALSPNFLIVEKVDKQTIKHIEDTLVFPVMVKPAGLAASRLVGMCYHKEELESFLKKVFKEIDAVYQETGGNWTPKVLVEEFIEGQMYSLDAFVSPSGKISYCPLVSIKTGKSIGFDDFFGYLQMTPPNLNTDSVAAAEEAAGQGIRALGLRATTAHVELFKTEQGWKIIEIGARVGGFRHMLYEFSFGMNHTMNDVLTRAGKKVDVKKKIQGYSAAMKFFGKKEGKLVKIGGIKKIQELKSLERLYINQKVGDTCKFAQHGGTSVFNLVLFHKDKSELLADIRRIEQTVDIQVE
ncbi:MAG: hypothetical protein CO030_01985 [Candidatus Magasanikbacteria bacterium CG_4_9_14_0_2_um_filter_42_11]|uniref:ATP-grasp domain-containing protein n=1 Tax=Candidatus Magasanikbacteria bacterium CG_4_9_14_0_2_um_filter_42_11 TaxID=1974643 RepID=A0A2M8FA60_9BACT|nr:MAG: hypothetical protein COU34_03490 [Candidatus Magasanikbacteria bacterium CG10_big_fil_rev_8_21_14_0_10_43_9]PIY92133.1 MAG: hypothetical protein COY70_04870 [Candidatus Magasanikbacteria bacterium CG_4_10_14_0_8_um_filter_42_12]PJC52607.1 MAG: hypothetical protein CO030_01985 [Candidatus Magasanikbacteria bacterium CG_4_9_14_0_2_um_filter_42_11]